jgi:hypothetical protein
MTSSSMSAWIGVDTYMDYFGAPNSNLQGGVRDPRTQSSPEANIIH